MKKVSTILLAVLSLLVASCNTTKRAISKKDAGTSPIHSIKLLGQYVIPYNFQYSNTTVGGLSSIDYNAADSLYYMICDDRSAINPARFYTAKIYTSLQGIDSVRFVKVTNLLQPGGNIYPNNKQDPFNTPDPEALRYNPINKQIIWSSEGERIVNNKDTVLSDPLINSITTDGKWIENFTIPQNLKMNAAEQGPRQNGVFEGITFADNYKILFVNVEEPLYEDGPRVDVTDNNTFIRILKFDVGSRKNTAQYAYKPEPIAYPANPESGFKINGIPDILSLGNNKLLVTERSFSTGRLACTIKVFITDLGEATDIKNIPSLKATSNFKPASKKLLLNFDDLGIYIDNIEGATFGPVLPNGHRSLIFIADNNFSIAEKSQVFLFEIE